MRDRKALRRCLLLLMFAAALGQHVRVRGAEEEEEASPLAAIDPRRAVVTMADGSQLKMKLADEPVVVQTANGSLSVPAGDVRRIVFGLRLTEEEQPQLAKWIETLGVPDLKSRKAAPA